VIEGAGKQLAPSEALPPGVQAIFAALAEDCKQESLSRIWARRAK